MFGDKCQASWERFKVHALWRSQGDATAAPATLDGELKLFGWCDRGEAKLGVGRQTGLGDAQRTRHEDRLAGSRNLQGPTRLVIQWLKRSSAKRRIRGNR